MTKDKTYRELDDIDLSFSTRIMKDSPDFGGVQIDMRLRLTEKAKQAIQEHIEGKVLEGRIAGIDEAHKAIMEYAYTYTGEDELSDFCGIDDLSRVAMSWKVDRIKQLKDKGGK